MHHLCDENQGMVYRKTFFTGDDIARSGYDIGTSPILYSGQTIRATVHLSVGEDVTARLFVRQYGSGQVLCGPEVPLQAGGTTDFAYRVDQAEAALIDRVGIAFSAEGPTTAVAYLDRVDWSGTPTCTLDLTRADPMAGWSYLRGRWFGRGGALNGSHYGADAEAYTGLQAWQDYRFKVQLRAHCGERHRVLFRVQGAQRSYAFGLAPDGRVAFEKNERGFREVASAPLSWELQRTYSLAVEVVGNRMTGFVDGQQVLQWEDEDNVWKTGCVGLGLHDGRTLYYRAALQPPD